MQHALICTAGALSCSLTTTNKRVRMLHPLAAPLACALLPLLCMMGHPTCASIITACRFCSVACKEQGWRAQVCVHAELTSAGRRV